MITSTLSYRVVLHAGNSAPFKTIAPVVASSLPLISVDAPLAAVLQHKRGDMQPGLYAQSGASWQKILPYQVLNDALLAPLAIDLYVNAPEAVPVPEGSELYMNGGECKLPNVPANDLNFWVIVSPAAGGSIEPGPDPVSSAVEYQAYIAPLYGSGYTGILTQWVITGAFDLQSFDHCRILPEQSPEGEEIEIEFSLRKNGETFATLLYNGETQTFEAPAFEATSFVRGDLLSFYQETNLMSLAPMTIMITNGS